MEAVSDVGFEEYKNKKSPGVVLGAFEVK